MVQAAFIQGLDLSSSILTSKPLITVQFWSYLHEATMKRTTTLFQPLFLHPVRAVLRILLCVSPLAFSNPDLNPVAPPINIRSLHWRDARPKWTKFANHQHLRRVPCFFDRVKMWYTVNQPGANYTLILFTAQDRSTRLRKQSLLTKYNVEKKLCPAAEKAFSARKSRTMWNVVVKTHGVSKGKCFRKDSPIRLYVTHLR